MPTKEEAEEWKKQLVDNAEQPLIAVYACLIS